MPELTTTKDSKRRSATEQNVYAEVYKVLLGGMFASTILFVIGIVKALLHPQFFPLTAEWTRQHYHWDVITRGLLSLDPLAVMLVATLLLILTPVARVLVSIYAFAVEGDRRYTVITSLVLLVMALTVTLGLFGLR